MARVDNPGGSLPLCQVCVVVGVERGHGRKVCPDCVDYCMEMAADIRDGKGPALSFPERLTDVPIWRRNS